MNENPYFNYLRYVREVLGAQSIVAESKEQNLTDYFYHPHTEIENKWDLIFVNCIFSSVESLFEEKSFELFQKMTTAMKMESQKVLAVDSSLMNSREIVRRWKGYALPKMFILFKDNPDISDKVRLLDDTAVIETYGPYQLLHHPEFKKLTWSHLKVVMEYFKTLPQKN